MLLGNTIILQIYFGRLNILRGAHSLNSPYLTNITQLPLHCEEHVVFVKTKITFGAILMLAKIKI